MTAQPLRSRNWFGRADLDGFAHRSWLRTEGFSDLVFDGRPVIGIANSWSELTNCNAHLRQVAEAVKRGVWSAGGFPLEFPTISLGEVLMKPTAMLFRNLMAMDVEECIRAYPLDAVVLLSGCECPSGPRAARSSSRATSAHGAVLKQSAASAHLLTHRGRAVVFEDHADLHRRIDDPSLPVDETSVLVVKHVGPKGAPGMPEWGAAPIPAKLLRQGVKDLVRISDARMSGTSYGTVVLHVAPESAIGGPLALVRDGDEIELDVPRRRLTLLVDDAELAQRRTAWRPRAPQFDRGYGRLFLDHVLQANRGCDFDFLLGRTPVRLEDTTGPSHA